MSHVLTKQLYLTDRAGKELCVLDAGTEVVVEIFEFKDSGLTFLVSSVPGARDMFKGYTRVSADDVRAWMMSPVVKPQLPVTRSLYEDDLSHTPDAIDLAGRAEELYKQLLEEYVTKGYSPREIETVFVSRLSAATSRRIIEMRRTMKR